MIWTIVGRLSGIVDKHCDESRIQPSFIFIATPWKGSRPLSIAGMTCIATLIHEYGSFPERILDHDEKASCLGLSQCSAPAASRSRMSRYLLVWLASAVTRGHPYRSETREPSSDCSPFAQSRMLNFLPQRAHSVNSPVSDGQPRLTMFQ